MTLPLIDLTGKTFTRWRVLRRGKTRNHNRTMWRCRCTCGTVRDVWSGSLLNGDSKSCGCLARPANTTQVIDLTSMRFGKLFVVERAPSPPNSNYAWWTVRCACGKIYDVSGQRLRNGQTSCGCAFNRRNRRHGQATHGQQTGTWRS